MTVDQSSFAYNFPTNSSSLHFLSRGPFVGAVNFVLADKDTSSEFINVTLNLEEADPSWLTVGEDPNQKSSVWAKLRPSWLSFPQWEGGKGPRAKICLLKDRHTEQLIGFAALVCNNYNKLWRNYLRLKLHLPLLPAFLIDPPTSIS